MLLLIEAELSSDLPSAKELLHWGEAARSPQEAARHSELAAMCKERLLRLGRGARVTKHVDSCVVELADGTQCQESE